MRRARTILGTVLLVVALAAPGWAVTESFTHADQANNLSADLTWTNVVGSLFGITSNQAKAIGTSDQTTGDISRADSDTATDTQTVQATLAAFDFGSGGQSISVGLICRKDSTSTKTWYSFEWYKDNTTSDVKLYKYVAGVQTLLTSAAQAVSASEVFKLTCSGNTITGFKNGSQRITTNDSAITGNLRGGLYYYGSGITSSVTWDDWSITSTGGGGGGVRGPIGGGLGPPIVGGN
jgi:hypothetical protein